jgi:hypothetical protein
VCLQCDISSQEIDKARFDAFCEEHGFLGWYPTSAKDNLNIEPAMDALVDAILALPVDGSPEAAAAAAEHYIKVDARDQRSGGPSKPCCE